MADISVVLPTTQPNSILARAISRVKVSGLGTAFGVRGAPHFRDCQSPDNERPGAGLEPSYRLWTLDLFRHLDFAEQRRGNRSDTRWGKGEMAAKSFWGRLRVTGLVLPALFGGNW